MERYFRVPNYSSAPSLTIEEAQDALLSSLRKIIDSYPPVEHPHIGFSGFYYGPTSICFLLLSLSNLYPELRIHSKSLVEWSSAYLAISANHFHRTSVDGSHCDVANERLTTLALMAVLEDNEQRVQELCEQVANLLEEDDNTSCEWLYGFAGLLYLLRFCRHYLPQTANVIDSAIRDVVNFIMSHQPWRWHGSDYIGAVHGTIGILTQLVLSMPSAKDLLRQLTPILSRLLELQLPSNNFPTRESSTRDELVQFCHGAPGFVTSLHTLQPFFPSLESKISSAIAKAERCILERGVLTKSPCICHGIYGNAMSLPRGDMLKFLKFNFPVFTSQKDESRDERYGLFTGEGGRAWAMAVAENESIFKFGKILGYNDL